MNKVLEVQFTGWTATPRMPFILSGNALCLPVPTYSILLGVIGCCLGRTVEALEVKLGFKYSFDSVGIDLETRHRLEFDGKRVRSHTKGTDAYQREFHVSPNLTIWLNRLDWMEYFKNPIGTPSLGRSQDILKIENAKEVMINSISEASISGCMLPFDSSLQIGGQLLQIAESFKENEEVGSGRTPVKTGIFMALPSDNERKIKFPNLFQTQEESPKTFYMHSFGNG
jgi:CRISPR-associated protein Cas5t